MKPVVFGSRFGWLHAGASKRGVVLCNTYGHEYVWTYSGMRVLAEALAAQGVWVLRFDYRGTGDSSGEDAAPGQFESSIDDIGAAVDFLKAQTGIQHVTLCGFRVGTAFAVQAALRRPVDDLVLLAPVVSGRTYMRELSVTRKTWFDQLAAPLREIQPQDGPFNVLGQVYGDDLKRDLECIDLAASVKRAGVAPARRALLMHGRVGSKDPLRDALVEVGVDAQSQAFEDMTGFIQESAFTVTPNAAFAKVVEWIAGDQPRQAVKSFSPWPEEDLRIETPEAIERPVCIGEEGIFGILCEPRLAASRGAVYLLANTSSSSRVGDSRLSVRIARDLARRGIASLRFDARGRGDSPAVPGIAHSDTPYNRIYNPVATQDTAAAARWLSRQGYKSILSFGICSGGYHALKAAVIETAITGVVAVNIPTFKQPEDKTAEGMRESTRNSMAGYAASMFELNKWKAILRGDKNLLRVLGFIGSYVTTRARSRIADAFRLDSLTHTPPEQATTPQSIARALDAKGVRTVLVYGSYDAGLDVLAAHCGKLGTRLARYRSVRVLTFSDVDHSLFNPASSAQIIALCESVSKETNVPVTQPVIAVRAPAVPLKKA
ncbi:MULTISPECIES: alpha/beta fold hydrolase [unclassified Caballeronia]|uniref:alpha/beta fold hydrolase n=1 Tax=unclassified Caballeronia TaxID=2646786 RepID=UPI002864DBE9|nr:MULTISPECIES: alpha/beta fold hydrolase [unclassified Caballeronia]MDR5739484.1 alpha/beta fold hydrolase [Caballeronia sp. LZ016]MDR5807973.1 alpha/beta fold hydrolase [Caballeronia sp. LZ019]